MARGGELDVAQKRLKNTVAQKKTRERKKLHGKWQRGLTSKAQLLVRQSLDLQWLTREEDAQGTLAAVREKVLPALNDLRKHLLNEPQPKRRVNVKDDDETEPPPPPPIEGMEVADEPQLDCEEQAESNLDASLQQLSDEDGL